jgi:hypothetical protein
MSPAPSITPPAPDDVDVYIVLDDFGGKLGRAWRESPEDRADRDAVIIDLLDGQFANPARIVAFNTANGWSRDVSRELAEMVVQDCSSRGLEVPSFLRGFIERSTHNRRAPLHAPGA